MSDSEEQSLLEMNSNYFDGYMLVQEQYIRTTRMIKVLIVIVTVILLIQLAMIGLGIYVYSTMGSFVNKVETILQDADQYTPQLESLFNFVHQAEQFIQWAEACVKAYGVCRA